MRLPIHLASGGSDAYVLPHVAGPGTFVYQRVYRKQGPFCSPAQFNTSNGLTIVWP